VTAIGRLKKRSEFLRVRDGSRFAAPSLVLQARRREVPDPVATDTARFGFTASKALGNAVMRNSARRRLKEAVRRIAPGHAREGYDYVLIARAGTLQRQFADLTRDLERALYRVHQPRP
jgi:ribonuclease P protein component